MKKLYVKMSECEVNALKGYVNRTGTGTYKRAIEQLIREDAVEVICVTSSVEKHLRKIAVNIHQMESFLRTTDIELYGTINKILTLSIQTISAFTSSLLRNIQRGNENRFEVQIRLDNDTKDALKLMKKAGSFRSFDALLRFMLTTRFDGLDLDTLESCFSIIKEAGSIINRTAHTYNANGYADLSDIKQIMPMFQNAVDSIVLMIGGGE